MTRAERVEQVHALKREGLNGIQIAERLGISRSFAYELLDDPTGEKVRKRKAKQGGVCIDCAGPTTYHTDGSAERCADCRATFEHESRRWTRESIIGWIRAYHAERGVVPPATVQTRRAEFPDAPGTDMTRREFGTDGWRKAVRAAGFEPYRDVPGTGHKLGIDHPLMQETARLYREGLSATQIAERHGVTSRAIFLRLDRLGVEIRDPITAAQLRRDRDQAVAA